jgi:hypothetical protein
MSNTQVGQLGRLAIRLGRGALLLFRDRAARQFRWVEGKEQEGPKTEMRGGWRKPIPEIFEKWRLTGQNPICTFTVPLLQGGAAW